MKFILGTVHFGMPYGLKKLNPIDTSEITKIMDYLYCNNINFIDTAVSYGDSETIIGKYNLTYNFNIISKIPKYFNSSIDIDSYKCWFNEQVILSKQRLKIDSFYALLFHQPSDIFSFNIKSIRTFLDDQKKVHGINKLGISVYSPEEAMKALSIYPFELIQFPLNIFDRRFEKSGFLKYAKSLSIEMHARSVFLQGTLINIDHESKLYKSFYKEFSSWYKFVNDNKVSSQAAAINFIKMYKDIDAVVIGVRSLKELMEITDIIRSLKKQESLKYYPSKLSSNKEELINPSFWSLL